MTNFILDPIGENLIRRIGRAFALAVILCAFFTVGGSKAFALGPCDAVSAQTVTRLSAAYDDPQSSDFGYARFDIWRNGETNHYVSIFTDAPDNTVFTAYFNGVELGTLERYPTSLFGEYWSWGDYNIPHPTGHVGDVFSVTKNGQPFWSGTYTREAVDYESADGSVMHPGDIPRCTVYRAQVFLPTSANPRTLRTYRMLAHTPAPNAATRITINEPGATPEDVGPEIAELPIRSTINSTGWVGSFVAQTDTVLTENQFTMLRQGALYVMVYDSAHPNGFSRIPITTQGINSGSDLEGDGMTDLALFRPSEQMWYLKYSSNQQTATIPFGHANDTLVVGDYDSDRKADLATFQPDDPNFPGKGVWHIFKSSNGEFQTIQWGLSADIPLTLNIDTNNTTDICVFRPAKGSWYIMRMGDIIKPFARGKNAGSLAPENNGQQHITLQWGMEGDKPLAGDFDNDGIDELVIFRPSDGNWYIYNYAQNNYQIFHWGSDGDIPMARDFDGDGKADMAVYRPSNGTWYIYGSFENNVIIRNFGIAGDIPVPADFDQDSVTDIAVFRPRNGTWYINQSSDNTYYSTRFGSNGDIPAVTAQ